MKVTGLKLTVVAASARGNWVFVELATDAGLVGLGEASQSGNDRLVMAALTQLGEQLRGADPTQPEVVWEQMARSSDIFSGGVGRVVATAVSAIDQAMWDLAGKALDVPVWRLLGGKRRDRVRLYANLNRGTSDRSAEGFARAARAAADAGFGAVKCTPFDEIRYDAVDRDHVERDLDVGIARIAACREAIGPETELLVDCHCRFNLPLANMAAEKVKDFNLYWFEEPLPRDQIPGMVSLCQSSGQTLAGGEAFFGREGFNDYLEAGAVHIIMPDVKHAGGITECRRIAAMAETKRVPVAPHSPAGPVSTIAGVHLSATIQNFLVLEHAFGEVPWRDRLTRPAERIEGGFIEVPDGPGLGIELHAETLRVHLVE